MKNGQRIALALFLATTAWPTFAADYFWKCTTSDGVKYWDASKCDKGDRMVKVMKGNNAPIPQAKPDSLGPGACPANQDYCSRPDFAAIEALPRAQAITQFMRRKQCEFLQRFPERCAKPH